MPKFEVRVVSYFQFDAEDAVEAKWLIENGQMPRDHQMTNVYTEQVTRVLDN